MKTPCPSHIMGFVYKLDNINTFIKYQLSEYHVPLKIKCTCGNEKFKIFKDDRPYVNAECSNCKTVVIVYDLSKYPAATDIEDDNPMKEVFTEEGDNTFEVIVIYEYPDDYPFDHSNFDNNDITACAVYGVGNKSKKVFEIINDETA